MAETIWVVEDRHTRFGPWRLRLAFDTRRAARSHVEGCIENADYSRWQLRVVPYVPRSTHRVSDARKDGNG